ncbi:MAG TPA: PDZ domain-containing protein, partial [Rhodocyclaceae bacterium]
MGIGFAIPVSLARTVLDQIIKNGTVTRGWIGVEIQEITPELAESFRLATTSGALIAGVMRGSPADKAGIKPGDVLQTINGKAVADAQSMLQLIAALEPSQHARFHLRRNSQDLDLDVAVGRRPKPKQE